MGKVVLMVVVGSMAALAPAAAAQAPSYGGGLLPAASAPSGYTPTVGIVLQPDGDRMALRFDTSIRCGRTVYDAVGRKSAPFDGRRFEASSASTFRIGTRGSGNRVIFAWSLRGQADGTMASGRLYIAGVRIIDGRRQRCRRKPWRRFQARLAGPAPTGAPLPPARAAFGGLSDIQLGASGLRAPVVVKVSRNARRAAARWTAAADCRRGPRLLFVNYSPPARIRPDGSFSRSERFKVTYADTVIRYRVRFAGRFSGEASNGVLRLRARIFNRTGRRLLTRCDTGPRNWTAALLRPVSP